VDEFTVNEVAARLKVTPLTVRRWLHVGAIRGVHQGDRARCRIREQDVVSFLDARRNGGTHPPAPRSVATP